MKTHYISSDGVMTEGTHQYPANSGMYLVIKSDGTTSVEAYTVAFGWSRLESSYVMLSSFLTPLPL